MCAEGLPENLYPDSPMSDILQDCKMSDQDFQRDSIGKITIPVKPHEMSLKSDILQNDKILDFTYIMLYS